MTENEVARVAVDAAFKVHTTLGPGLLESVYEKVVTLELERRGLRGERQVKVPIVYEGIVLDETLVLANKRLGLPINFGTALLTDGLTRVANGLPD